MYIIRKQEHQAISEANRPAQPVSGRQRSFGPLALRPIRAEALGDPRSRLRFPVADSRSSFVEVYAETHTVAGSRSSRGRRIPSLAPDPTGGDAHRRQIQICQSETHTVARCSRQRKMQQLAAGLAIHCWICCHDQEQEDPMSII